MITLERNVYFVHLCIILFHLGQLVMEHLLGRHIKQVIYF